MHPEDRLCSLQAHGPGLPLRAKTRCSRHQKDRTLDRVIAVPRCLDWNLQRMFLPQPPLARVLMTVYCGVILRSELRRLRLRYCYHQRSCSASEPAAVCCLQRLQTYFFRLGCGLSFYCRRFSCLEVLVIPLRCLSQSPAGVPCWTRSCPSRSMMGATLHLARRD